MLERCNRPAVVYSIHNGYRLCSDCFRKSTEAGIWANEGLKRGSRCDYLINSYSTILEKIDYRRKTSAK